MPAPTDPAPRPAPALYALGRRLAAAVVGAALAFVVTAVAGFAAGVYYAWVRLFFQAGVRLLAPASNPAVP